MNTDKQPADLQGENNENMTEEQILEAMFSNLVIQQTRTALFTLGQIPDPNSGQRILDLDTAQMLIATLEMLKEKTKGNLSPKEDELITHSIDQLHDIFEHTIQAIEKAQAEKGGQTESGLYTPPSGLVPPDGTTSSSSSVSFTSAPESTPTAAAPEPVKEAPAPKQDDDDSHKRFSKKY